MYSIILSNVVGRLQHTSMIATAHEHAPHTMSNIHSTKFLILVCFKLIIKKRLPFVYTLGGITQQPIYTIRSDLQHLQRTLSWCDTHQSCSSECMLQTQASQRSQLQQHRAVCSDDPSDRHDCVQIGEADISPYLYIFNSNRFNDPNQLTQQVDPRGYFAVLSSPGRLNFSVSRFCIRNILFISRFCTHKKKNKKKSRSAKLTPIIKDF